MTEARELAVKVADQLGEYISKNDYVSHGELLNRFGGLPLRGDKLCLLSPTNIVLFAGCSDAFIDAVQILTKEEPVRAVIEPCHFLVMYSDNCPMVEGMPFAKSPPKGGYKKEHFLPVVFRPFKENADAT